MIILSKRVRTSFVNVGRRNVPYFCNYNELLLVTTMQQRETNARTELLNDIACCYARCGWLVSVVSADASMVFAIAGFAAVSGSLRRVASSSRLWISTVINHQPRASHSEFRNTYTPNNSHCFLFLFFLFCFSLFLRSWRLWRYCGRASVILENAACGITDCVFCNLQTLFVTCM